MIRQPANHPAADRLTLDELTALCEEMVSLSRAGIPLDRGLVQLASDLPGRLSVQAQQISQRLQAGQSLADVVSSEESPFPAVYQSVVEAGLRSGRITVALEGFARLARQIAELRRLVVAALVYPLVLMVVVGVISLFVLRRFGPMLTSAFSSLTPRGTVDGWESSMLAAFDLFSQWFWVIPVGMFLLGIFCLLSTRRVTAAQSSRFSDWVNWVPGARRLLRNSRLQAFTEVLGLLVGQQVPLDQALRLAGAASGDRGLHRDAELLASQMQRGETSTADGRPIANGIPPFIRWSLVTCQHSGKLESAIDRASETYQRRTEDASMWLRMYVPIIFSVCFGGFVAMLYAATVFLPWYTMLRALDEALTAI